LKFDPEKMMRPAQGFNFKRIAVRDFVTLQIASELKLPEEPDQYWTKEQWAALRKQGQDRLARQNLPD
jgi:hypothetical protein